MGLNSITDCAGLRRGRWPTNRSCTRKPTRTTTWRLAGAVSLLALALGACGGGGGGGGAAQPQSAAAPAPAPSPGSPGTPDTTPPTVSIAVPTTAASFTATAQTINLSGTAADNVGVVQVTWSDSLGGSGTATGATSWSISGLALAAGANIITVTAADAAGNKGTATITVSWTPPPTSYAFTWQAVSDSRVTGYRVYWSTAPFSSGATPTTVDLGNVTSFPFTRVTLGNLASGTTVYMSVAALGSGLESPLTAPVSSAVM